VRRPEDTSTAHGLVLGLLAAGLMLLLSACGSGSPDERMASPVPTRTLIPVTSTPSLPAVTASPVPTDLPNPAALMTQTSQVHVVVSDLPASALAQIDRATADLAQQVGTAPSDIHLIGLEAFTWRDASWGCATLRGDETPPVAVTRGYRIILQYGDQIVVYHTDEGTGVARCDYPGWLALEGRPIVGDPITASIVQIARQDAARRLGVQPGQVRTVSVIAVTWPDSSLGCPRVGVEYSAQPTRGYRLVFEAGSARLIYHTSIQDSVPCAPADEILPGALRQALPAPTVTPPPGT